MKRFISILLLIAMSVSFAFAEQYSSMTDDELLTLYHQIQSELLSRSRKFTITLDSGTYQVGRDIPSGTYRVELDGATGSCHLALYESESASRPSESFAMTSIGNSASVGRIVFLDGNIVKVKGTALKLINYNAAQIEVVEEQAASKTAESSDDGLEVSPGRYVIGEEIPAGTYSVVCEGSYSFATLMVYDTQNSRQPSLDTFISPMIGSGKIGKLELLSGNILEIQDGTVTLYKYTGIK